jgi:hypothetical protein
MLALTRLGFGWDQTSGCGAESVAGQTFDCRPNGYRARRQAGADRSSPVTGLRPASCLLARLTRARGVGVALRSGFTPVPRRLTGPPCFVQSGRIGRRTNPEFLARWRPSFRSRFFVPGASLASRRSLVIVPHTSLSLAPTRARSDLPASPPVSARRHDTHPGWNRNVGVHHGGVSRRGRRGLGRLGRARRHSGAASGRTVVGPCGNGRRCARRAAAQHHRGGAHDRDDFARHGPRRSRRILLTLVNT